jgi:hypothetical protein
MFCSLRLFIPMDENRSKMVETLKLMEHGYFVWGLFLWFIRGITEENASLTFRMESVPFSYGLATLEEVVLGIVR